MEAEPDGADAPASALDKLLRMTEKAPNSVWLEQQRGMLRNLDARFGQGEGGMPPRIQIG